MTDESAGTAFDLDAALSTAYAEVTSTETEKVEAKPETSETEIAKDNTEAQTDTDQGSDSKDEPAQQPLTPPERWSAERKATFNALPREAQQLLLDREGEVDKAFTQKTQELAEQRKQYEALDQVIAPRRQQLAQYGGEAQAINTLFQISDFAERDPEGYIKWFAQQRGINLNQTGDDVYIDPVTQQLTQRLSTIEQNLNAQQQAQLTARQDAVKAEITTFKEAKDSKGALLRPYFDEVKIEMASLMQGGIANTLEDAYARAVRANPTVYERIRADEKKAEEALRIEQAKQAASKAEKAKGTVIHVKKSNEATTAKKTGWEDTLNDLAGELYGAA